MRCRFIAGDPRAVHQHGDGIYCGKPVAREGEAWCPEHRALCYVAPARLSKGPATEMKNAA
jgi:hypothetical protein